MDIQSIATLLKISSLFPGFASVDLEKPHFKIKPVADKIPFCISKQFAKPVCNVSKFIDLRWYA